jgi:hypothetical protein
VLAGAEHEAGIASAVNNAVARVAGLIGTAAVGAAISASFVSRLGAGVAHAPLGAAARAALAQAKHLPLGVPDVHGLPAGQAYALAHAAERASLHSFHLGLAIAAALVAGGGVIGVVGIRNPGRQVRAEECPGGQLVGASRHLARSATVPVAGEGT